VEQNGDEASSLREVATLSGAAEIGQLGPMKWIESDARGGRPTLRDITVESLADGHEESFTPPVTRQGGTSNPPQST